MVKARLRFILLVLISIGGLTSTLAMGQQAAQAPQLRKWKYASGQFSVDAEFMGRRRESGTEES
jgi:hypothetical protein